MKNRCSSKQIPKDFQAERRKSGNGLTDEARHGKALKGLLERYFAADIAKEKVVNAAEKAADKVGNVVNGVVEKIKNM